MDIWEQAAQKKRDDERAQLERQFSAFERAVLVAYLDRSIRDLPTYHPAKALRILRRWPRVIERARRFMFEVKQL